MENSHFEKEIFVLITKADLGFKKTSKMEIFIAYHQHIGAYPGHLELLCKHLRWRVLQK